jgi:uncharacterized protein
MDLVIDSGNNKISGIEIKYSLSPKPTKGFWSALSNIGCKRAFIVYPGKESYPLSDMRIVSSGDSLNFLPRLSAS